MYIGPKDLDLLIRIENKLGSIEDWSEDVTALWQLNERLIKEYKKQKEKTRVYIAERRKTDKNYARPKPKNWHG